MVALPIAPNLELRHFELHHAELLFDLIDTSRAHLRRYLNFVDDASVDSAEDFIRRSRARYAKDGTGNFGVWADDTLVGAVSLFDLSPMHRKAEVGYWIGQAFAGRGIITKAVSRLLDYGFSELKLNRIQLCCATDNPASRRVAEKLGFVLEGVAREDRVLRGTRVSHQVWSLLAADTQPQPAHFTKPLGEGAELRLLELRHAQDLLKAVDSSREHLRAFLPWVDGNTKAEHFEGFIKGSLDRFAQFNGNTYGIWQDNQLAGVIGMHGIDWTHLDSEFGYWLAQPFTGRGLMTRAGRAVLSYCFDELNLHRISIAHSTENTSSRKVIERLGFKPESVARDAEWLHDRFHHWQKYGLLKREWQT